MGGRARRGACFGDLGADLQFHILSLVPLEERYNATLACRDLHAYEDREVAIMRRVFRLMESRDVRKKARVTVEVTGRDLDCSRWRRFPGITISGVENAWRVTAELGREQTQLKTGSCRRAMHEVARLLPAMLTEMEARAQRDAEERARREFVTPPTPPTAPTPPTPVAVAPRVIRQVDRYFPSHVFGGPGMKLLRLEPWERACGPVGQPPWRQRLELLLAHLSYGEQIVIHSMHRVGRITVYRKPSDRFWTLLDWPAWVERGDGERIDDVAGVLRYLDGLPATPPHPRPQPVAIHLTRPFLFNQDYQYPDFEMRLPAWAQ